MQIKMLPAGRRPLRPPRPAKTSAKEDIEPLLKQPRFPRQHPLIRRIEDIIKSDAGRTVAKQPAEKGVVALAGVDPLLRSALGDDYGLPDTTSWAGVFVTEIMKKAGYMVKRSGVRISGPGYVAKWGTLFKI
jgi:hypothetical protein